jgi:hypothetical protein
MRLRPSVIERLSWMPIHKVAVRLLGAATVLSLLAGCAPVDTPVAGEGLGPQSENPWTAVAACLENAGYPGFVVDDSGLVAPPGVSDDEEQFKLLLEAEAVCADEAGFYSGPFPTEELPRLYALELEEIDCLKNMGYEAAEPPPSRQTFIDNYSQGTPWEAFTEVYSSLPPSKQTDELYAKLEGQCPPPASRFVKD